jgi:preprotein translocase subunit YajC
LLLSLEIFEEHFKDGESLLLLTAVGGTTCFLIVRPEQLKPKQRYDLSLGREIGESCHFRDGMTVTLKKIGNMEILKQALSSQATGVNRRARSSSSGYIGPQK